MKRSRSLQTKRLEFERLEPRLVFAVQLDIGPIPDVVTVAPSQQPGQFTIAAGAALSTQTGKSWGSLFAGTGLYQSAASNQTVLADSFIAVDTTKTYGLSGWARAGDDLGLRYQPNNQQSLGYSSFDRDFKQILPQHVLRFAGAADTTLSAPLNPGDTTVHLNSAAGWSNASGASPLSRGLAWYGYIDSTGQTYANYTYTRNTAMGGANGLWLPGGVSGNVITLAAPWSGPALPAGTAMRDTGTGDAAAFVALDSQPVPNDWTYTEYAAVFGGQTLQSGNNALTQFRPGTAYIKPVIVVNEQGGTANTINWSDVRVTELAAGSTAAALAPPVVDLSTVSGGDQRATVDLAGLYSGEALVKVNTSQQYTMSGVALNPSEWEERPLAFVSYDVDRKLIHPLHVTKYRVAADTTLAAQLTPGATSILVTNASGWSNDAWESASTRSLAWYGYADSTGHTYADYTYTRNVAFDLDNGLWQPGAIVYDATAGAYRINLSKPWNGPALAAGATIRNAASGDVFSRPRETPGIETRGEWVDYSATIGGGQWTSGTRDEELFRPGTIYIKPVFTSTGSSGNVVIAPINSTAATSTAAIPADHHVDVDLDVLAKNALPGSVSSAAGDFNRDGFVDSGDWVLWRKTLFNTGLTPYTGADGTGDGQVGGGDYILWASKSGNVGAPGTVVIDSVATPKYGTATMINGPNGTKQIHYQSNAWFVGTDVVTYTLRNTTTNKTFSSSVAVQVTGSNYEQSASTVATLAAQAEAAGNTAPRAFDDVYKTTAGVAILGDGGHASKLLDSDLGGTDTLVARLISGPSHGTLSLNYDGTFVYAPEAGFVGTDLFRYEAFDGQYAESAGVSITVLASDESLVLDRLRSVSLAMQNYHDSLKRLPLVANASYFDANGNPYLSWRVHLLPYLGYQSLYNQFHLNEPWDSANNLPLASKMPDIFRNPADTATSMLTRFQIISGEGAPYYWRRSGNLLVGPTLANISDGTSNTAIVTETGADKAVVWSKPDPTSFDPNNPLASLGTITDGKIRIARADGSTVTLSASISAQDFKSLITVSGGETVDSSDVAFKYPDPAAGFTSPASDAVTINQLKNFALAMLNYHDSKGRFPVASTSSFFDANGNPYLSWRVYILPFIEQTALYNRFHMDEPWDSPNNLPMLAEMPALFRSSGDPSDSATTRFVTLTGPDAPFGFRAAGVSQIGPRIIEFADGETNTILVLQTGADKAVAWTKPDDAPFDKNNPLASLGDLSSGKFFASFADGSVRAFGSDISPAIFSALATRNGKEVVDASTVYGREVDRTGIPPTGASMVNNFKQASVAMMNYYDSRKSFPASTATNLSWRVLLLPYLGYSNLYSKFKLTEPWDSPNNLPLLDEMPDIFRSVGDPWDSVTTRMLEFVGPSAAFHPNASGNPTGPTSIQQMTDGTSKTIQLFEAGRDSAVPWTKAADGEFYLNNPFSPMGDIGPNFITSYFDGHIETKSAAISPSLLKAFITYQGGEDVNNPPAITTVPGFYISQTAGNTVLGEFGVDAFDVVLDKAPLSNVVLSLGVSDMAVATSDKTTLTFAPANWNLPQRVYIRGVDNHVINPDHSVNISVSVVAAQSDDAYDGVAQQTFVATVRNDDFAAADYDHNGLVEQADYTTWRSNYGGNQNNSLAADGNLNGTVDAGDYVFWRKKLATPAAGTGDLVFAPSSVESAPDDVASDKAFAQLASVTTQQSGTGATTLKRLNSRSMSRLTALNDSAVDLLLAINAAPSSLSRGDFSQPMTNAPAERPADNRFGLGGVFGENWYGTTRGSRLHRWFYSLANITVSLPHGEQLPEEVLQH
jgi:hypothetical protein